MIKDLFHSPPIYKATITLSFKPKPDAKNGAAKTAGPKVGEKRKPITFSSGGGAGAGGKKRQLYMDSVGDSRGGNGNRIISSGDPVYWALRNTKRRLF